MAPEGSQRRTSKGGEDPRIENPADLVTKILGLSEIRDRLEEVGLEMS